MRIELSPAALPNPAGLTDAHAGASIVVDVSNSTSPDNAAALEFFETSVAYFGDVEHSFRLVPDSDGQAHSGA